MENQRPSSAATKDSWFRTLPNISSSISSSIRRQVSRSRPLPVEFLDHSSLTSFAEILPGTGSPTEEADELGSDHVAYNLTFVEDYFAASSMGYSNATGGDIAASALEASQQCQSCAKMFAATANILETCECCRTILCKDCYGPSVFSFKFPRIDKTTGRQIETPDSNGAARMKELCQRCMKCCAGPKKKSYCRLAESNQQYTVSYFEASHQRNASRQAVDRLRSEQQRHHKSSASSARLNIHQRQLTQLSIQIAGVHAASGGGPGWTSKMAAFFWKVTTSISIWSQPFKMGAIFSWLEDGEESRRQIESLDS